MMHLLFLLIWLLYAIYTNFINKLRIDFYSPCKKKLITNLYKLFCNLRLKFSDINNNLKIKLPNEIIFSVLSNIVKIYDNLTKYKQGYYTEFKTGKFIL